MLFAHLKRILRLDRLRLRGPSGAKDEFLLAATAQNLRKLAKLAIPLLSADLRHPRRSTQIGRSDRRRNRYPRLSTEGFFNTISHKGDIQLRRGNGPNRPKGARHQGGGLNGVPMGKGRPARTGPIEIEALLHLGRGGGLAARC